MNNMKKTAKEWYQQLPEPIRSEAIENWNKSDITGKGDLLECLPDSLEAFWWDWTPQLFDYWKDIKDRARNGEFNQPTPNLHGWIPVGEMLPTVEDGDENGDVMVLDKNKMKSICKPKWVKINIDLIQFWQPLPKLPEVKNV